MVAPIYDRKEELAKRNYVRIADSKNSYWVDFTERKLKKYRHEFGETFSLIIISSKTTTTDFYIIPFSAVSHLFNDDSMLIKPRKRWMASIENHQLNVRETQAKVDISRYYGALQHLDGNQ